MIKKFMKLTLSIFSMIVFMALFAVYAVGAYDDGVNSTERASTIETTTALPTASTVFVNGENVSFDAFNINGFNYFKLRDLAYTLSGTSRQFGVGWDNGSNAILITSGSPYTIVGGEMANVAEGNKMATPTTSRIYFDGNEVQLTAYNIEGSNYFMLRDIGEVVGFYVGWDDENGRIIIDTNDPFEDSTIAFSARFIRTAGVPLNTAEELVVITSLSDFEQSEYFNNRLSDVMPMYTEDFFIDSYLVITSVFETSGSIRHEVESVSVDGEIVIGRYLPTGTPTADLGEYLVIVELNNTFLPEEFSVIVNNVGEGWLPPVVNEYQRITAQEAKEMKDSGEPFVLLDVRTETEFRESRIEGAILIPDFEIGSRAIAELSDKSTRILVYCRSGVRSSNVARELNNMGFANVYDFGGIIDWPFDTISG